MIFYLALALIVVPIMLLLAYEQAGRWGFTNSPWWDEEED